MRICSLLGGLFALALSQVAMADVSPHLALTMGLAGGGDTLASLKYTNGDSEKVTAGGGLYLGAGPSFEFSGTPVSVQALLGYHIDNNSSNSSGADISFERSTLDLMGFYRMGNHRLGMGIYDAISPKFHNNDFYDSYGTHYPSHTVDFKDSSGLELEYNYLPAHSRFGLSIRVVSVSYTPKSVDGTPVSGNTISGNFIAAGLYFYL